MNLNNLESTIGYKFKDDSLLLRAMTHSSYTAEHNKSYSSNNERLEFIGDAYLDAIVGHKIFDIVQDCTEGILSQKRAEVVCEASLAMVARELHIGDCLLLGHGEELTGGRDRESMLADALEALIGAIIIDGGYEEGRRVVLDIFAERIRDSVQGKINNDFKSRLQELIQKKYNINDIKYKIVAEEGPAHDKSFTAEIQFHGKTIGRGIGKSKAKAEQAAAQQVISKGEI